MIDYIPFYMFFLWLGLPISRSLKYNSYAWPLRFIFEMGYAIYELNLILIWYLPKNVISFLVSFFKEIKIYLVIYREQGPEKLRDYLDNERENAHIRNIQDEIQDFDF